MDGLTDTQRELVAVAQRLAARFAERAEQHDREASFPFDNFDDLRHEGFLALALPPDLGGSGLRSTTSACCRRPLARGCGATALGTNMHWYNLGGGLHLFTDSLRRRVADAIVREGASSPAASPSRARVLGAPQVVARKVAGGYRITDASTSAPWRRSCASSSSTRAWTASIDPGCPAR